MALGPVSAVYSAQRAASLAGVPERTLYYWVSTGLVLPSVSRIRPMQWSYSDLLLLRLVEWLRRRKDDLEIPGTSIAAVRRALDRVDDLGEQLLSEGLVVYVNQAGQMVFEGVHGLFIPLGVGVDQQLVNTRVNLVSPFEYNAGLTGPNLVQPRPTLRILPGKLSGEPHVDDTRIPTSMIAALASRGLGEERIRILYPELVRTQVVEAVDLEDQLATNARAAA